MSAADIGGGIFIIASVGALLLWMIICDVFARYDLRKFLKNNRRDKAAGRSYAATHGGKFTTRQCKEDGVPGTRVWRIE